MCDKHEKILSVLMRGSVRRARPDNQEVVRATVCASSNLVKIVGHWGVGQKVVPNEVDLLSLNRLQEIQDQTGGAVWFHLLLADEHGRLNGLNPGGILTYLEGIEVLAKERGIETAWLSRLWPQWGVREPFGEVVDEVWSGSPLAPILEERAARHHRGDRTPREDAKRYYAMARDEGLAIARAFPGAVWFTYGDPRLRDLYPPMPTVYFWPYKKGHSNSPWFL